MESGTKASQDDQQQPDQPALTKQEKHRAYRQWVAKHRERRKASQKVWYKEHRERERARSRAYYQKHRESVRERQQQYYKRKITRKLKADRDGV
jgi:hypothetical protein